MADDSIPNDDAPPASSGVMQPAGHKHRARQESAPGETYRLTTKDVFGEGTNPNSDDPYNPKGIATVKPGPGKPDIVLSDDLIAALRAKGIKYLVKDARGGGQWSLDGLGKDGKSAGLMPDDGTKGFVQDILANVPGGQPISRIQIGDDGRHTIDIEKVRSGSLTTLPDQKDWIDLDNLPGTDAKAKPADTKPDHQKSPAPKRHPSHTM